MHVAHVMPLPHKQLQTPARGVVSSTSTPFPLTVCLAYIRLSSLCAVFCMRDFPYKGEILYAMLPSRGGVGRVVPAPPPSLVLVELHPCNI
jgi:hypothetical protein